MNDSATEDEIKKLMENDLEMINYANKCREGLYDSPAQSEFRVYAILVVIDATKQMQLIHGSNCEQGYIGGAICAERAAICRLRFLKDPVILSVAVVSDSENPLSPGALCREFLMTYAQPNVKVLMGNHAGNKISSTELGRIWPFPYSYRFKRRSEVLLYAKEMAKVCEKPLANTEADRLYKVAMSVNGRDTHDKIHPIRFSAAVLLEDGSIHRAWQLKGLEYGCTIDPVTQLLHVMHSKKNDFYCARCSDCPGSKGSDCQMCATIIATPVPSVGEKHKINDASIKPIMLVMVDQFGVAHAPFAQSRALLTEHGMLDTVVLVHDSDGSLKEVSTDDLLPHPPDCPLLSHDDFH